MKWHITKIKILTNYNKKRERGKREKEKGRRDGVMGKKGKDNKKRANVIGRKKFFLAKFVADLQ